MTATVASASSKLASGPSTWRSTNNVRRVRKLERKSRQTNGYNIFRWYRSGFARYTQADPIGLEGGDNLYQYALSNPIRVFDSAGLAAELLCREVSAAAGSNAFQKTVINLYKPLHCRLRVTCKCDTSTGSGFDKTLGRENVNPKGSPGIYDTTIDNYSSTAYPSPPWSSTPIGTSGSGCEFEKCAMKAFGAQDANPGLVPTYNGLGPNSNTYVNELVKQCGGNTSFPKKAKGYDFYN